MQVQQRVKQQGEEIEGRQQGGEMLLAVPEIVRQVIALGLEGVVVLVLDLPAGAAGAHDLGNVAGVDRAVARKGVVIHDLAVRCGGGQLAPVHLEGIGAVAQRHFVHEAVGIGVGPFALPALDGERLHLTAGGQPRHPLIQRFVGIGLAHQDKIQPLPEDGFAQRLLTVEVVAQDRDAQGAVTRTELGEPTFGRGGLAILFLMAVLREDKLRLQGQYPRIARRHDHRRHDAVGIGDAAVGMLGNAALRAMDLGGRKILGTVHRHQQIAADAAIGLQMTVLTQHLHHGGKDRQHRRGRNRVEQIPDLVVARDLRYPKQGQGVVAPLRYLQGALEIQERRALREEHRERPERRIRHGIRDIARALVGKTLDHRPKELDQAAEGIGAQVGSERETHRHWELACTFPSSYTGNSIRCLVPIKNDSRRH